MQRYRQIQQPPLFFLVVRFGTFLGVPRHTQDASLNATKQHNQKLQLDCPSIFVSCHLLICIPYIIYRYVDGKLRVCATYYIVPAKIGENQYTREVQHYLTVVHELSSALTRKISIWRQPKQFIQLSIHPAAAPSIYHSEEK